MMPLPSVSVIIPVHNGEAHIAEAIASVQAQTLTPFEIIVVDDGSTDQTFSVLSRLGDAIRLVRQANQGPAAARNTGLALSQGELIAFLDADDLWMPDKLETQVQPLVVQPEVGYSVSRVKFELEPGMPMPEGFRKEWLDTEPVGYLLSALVARRSTFDRVGLFDPALRLSEDVDWFARAKDLQVPVHIAPVVLLHKRFHQANISLVTRDDNAALLEAVARSVRRKQASPRPKTRPLISVVIAAYNAAPYLAETLESVLAQTYTPVEIIVVDDGSTDETPTVAGRYATHFGGRIRVEALPHRGVAATLNHGLALAQGALLAILDADDLWLPAKLQKQAEILESRPDLDMVFCHAQNFISPDMTTEAVEKLQVNLDPIPAYHKSAMLIRREAFLRVGYFDPAWQLGDFIDWYAKAVEAGLKSEIVPEVLYRRRVHGQNMTIAERATQGDYVRILKAALDRRRGLNTHL
jgi:glycosyltransferase involved in cell wall biosynthesis